MKIKNLSICILLLFSQLSYAQKTYTDFELQSFVNIYMDAKLNKSKKNDILEDKMIEYNITKERYKSIFNSNINGQKSHLSENEVNFFNDLQEKDKFIKEKDVEIIKRLCVARKIDTNLFFSIRQKYKTDIRFQRSLKPYFDHYINAQK